MSRRRAGASATPPIVLRSLALLLPLGPVEARRMFGGWGFFLDGTMIALATGEALYLKTDDASQARFAAAGSEPFVYRREGRPVALSYWQAPATAMDDAEAMLPWAELARAAARRAAARKAGRRAAPGSGERRLRRS